MNKVVVYTAIMGGIDNVINPKFVTPEVDYICFTDSSTLKSDVWKIIKVENNYDNSRLKAREIKLNPHIFLKNYEYSIWVDGNVEILQDLTPLISDIFMSKKKLITTFKHPERECVYQEFLMCMHNRNDSLDNLYRQLKLCIDSKYPTGAGLCETNVMFRIHGNKICQNIMDQWWSCLRNNSIRDQLSFNYILYMNEQEYAELGGNARGNSNYFNCKDHNIHILDKIKIKVIELLKKAYGLLEIFVKGKK